MWWRRKRRADPWKIHAAEYDLGLRNDPPPPPEPTDEPGTIIWYNPASPGARWQPIEGERSES